MKAKPHNIDKVKLKEILESFTVFTIQGEMNLLTYSHAQPLPFARDIVLNFCRKNGMTSIECGTIFPGRSVKSGTKDHSSVLTAIKRYEFRKKNRKQYPDFDSVRLELEPILSNCLNSREDVLEIKLKSLSKIERMIYEARTLPEFLLIKNFVVKQLN